MQDPMPSGWFPDPLGRYDHRYFNGQAWTSGGGNGAATAAVVMGSIALVVAWVPFVVVIGIVLAVLAIVFGLRGLRRARETGRGRAAALSGTIMGALGLGAAAVGVWLSVIVWNEVVDFVEPGDHDVQSVTCAIDGRSVGVSGVIENRTADVQSYTVFVEIDDRTSTAIVDDVAPGETVGWQTEVTARSVQDTCDPDVIVHGPFPFGLEIDPVNGSISP